MADIPRTALLAILRHHHVIKLFNKRLSDLRGALYNRATAAQKVIEVIQWLLLKASENLDPKRDEKGRLKKAVKLNRPLATANYLTEELRQFWDQPGKRFAGAFLTDWIRRVEASDPRMVRQISQTLESHRAGLLAYYDYPISISPPRGQVRLGRMHFK
jgi:hypothetical protein